MARRVWRRSWAGRSAGERAVAPTLKLGPWLERARCEVMRATFGITRKWPCGLFSESRHRMPGCSKPIEFRLAIPCALHPQATCERRVEEWPHETQNPSSTCSPSLGSFPSPPPPPTPRSKFDPRAPLFGSRTSGRRYEWIVYRGGAGHVDRIEHGGGAGHGREPDENSGACSGPSHIATRRCF